MGTTGSAIRAWGSIAVAAFALTACGAAEPVGDARGFHLASGDTRAYGAYRQTSPVARGTIAFAAGSRHVRVRMDCIGTGEIGVAVFGGRVTAPCSEDSQPAGFISLTKQRAVTAAGTSAVVVHVSKDAVWSVAVDVGPGPVRGTDQ